MPINYLNNAGKFKLIQTENVLFKATSHYRINWDPLSNFNKI
jgi:hypothetical protein